MKQVNQKKWTKESDEYILCHTIDESAMFLNRSKQSIKMRRWRLNNE